jgi:hypothetical protein
MSPVLLAAESGPRLPPSATATVVLIASLALTAAWVWRLYK